MPDPNAPLKLGANCWNQYTDWPSFLAAQQRADRLGYDSLWTWDHLYPIVGSAEGPIFECYTAMAAVAASDASAPRIGLMVGANTFRNPALVAKMVTTLDHISGGRAVLGIGAAWFETEHRAFGIPFGSGPGERLRWLARGAAHHARHARWHAAHRDRVSGTRTRGRAQPARRRCRRICPSSSAAAARKVTLRLVARTPTPATSAAVRRAVRETEAHAASHTARPIGRDEREIERTVGMGVPVIRDSRGGGPTRARGALRAQWRRPAMDRPAGRHRGPGRRPLRRRTWSWAIGISSSASRHRTTRRR